MDRLPSTRNQSAICKFLFLFLKDNYSYKILNKLSISNIITSCLCQTASNNLKITINKTKAKTINIPNKFPVIVHSIPEFNPRFFDLHSDRNMFNNKYLNWNRD